MLIHSPTLSVNTLFHITLKPHKEFIMRVGKQLDRRAGQMITNNNKKLRGHDVEF